MRGGALRNFFSLHLLDARFPALHGARVLAILSVLQVHVTNAMLHQWGARDRLGFQVSRGVWFGMDLFFILSGFLIGSLLFQQAAGGGVRQIARFYARRSFRIFPAYYVVLTLLVLMPFTEPFQREGVGWEYVYLVNYVAKAPVLIGSWSLCVEEHFYLLVPLLIAAVRVVRSGRGQFALLLALWAGCGLLRVGDYLVHFGRWTNLQAYFNLYSRTHDRMDILIAGVLLAFVHSRGREQLDAALARPGVRRALGVVFFVCLWLLLLPPVPRFAMLWNTLCWGTITSVMYGALVPLLIAGDGWVKRALSAPLFRTIATLGYGVYLLHVPICLQVVLPLIKVLALRFQLSALTIWTLSLALLFALSLAAAYVLHLLVEKPALALRDRLVPAASRAPPQPGA